MTDDRVTVTMSDGTTREVDESTPVESPEGIITVAHYAEIHANPVSTVYEPTREHWTPYEPWMRDVLADDARVSWHEGGDDYRAPFVHRHQLAEEWDLRVHPDDVPERPTEDEALAKVLLTHIAGTRGMTWDNTGLRGEYRAAARAAREHIAREQEDALVDSSQQVRAEKAEAERDGAKEEAAEAHSTAIYAESVARKAEDERDEWRVEAEDNARRETTQRNRADAWEDRHEALRADVEGVVTHFAEYPADGVRPHRVARRITWDVLDRDDERGECDHDYTAVRGNTGMS